MNFLSRFPSQNTVCASRTEAAVLSYETLCARLRPDQAKRLCFYDETDSTNRRLEALWQEGRGRHGLIAVANAQTAGRGRQGKSFSSPRDLGVYLSMLLLPSAFSSAETSLSTWTALTSCAAVAMCNAIAHVSTIRPHIKWVNDLYLGGKKLGGILTQAEPAQTSDGKFAIILGIGINVLEEADDFPESLRSTATSLYAEAGQFFSRTALTAAMIDELEHLLSAWPQSAMDCLPLYRRDCLVLGKEIFVSTATGKEKATALAIADDYALQVRYADGKEDFLRGGEVTIRLS